MSDRLVQALRSVDGASTTLQNALREYVGDGEGEMPVMTAIAAAGACAELAQAHALIAIADRLGERGK